MRKSAKAKIKIPAGNNKPKIIRFTSTRSNIKKVIEISKGNPELLKKEIGHIEVSEFFKIIKGIREYDFVFKIYAKKTMSEFLEKDRPLFLEIMRKEIYKWKIWKTTLK